MTVLVVILIFILTLSLNPDFLDLRSIYSIVLPCIYIGLNLFYFKKYKNGELFNFEFLFSLSFFFSCFLTPFVYPLLDDYTSRYFISDPTKQYRAYLVCMIGYLFYFLGLTYKYKKYESRNASLKVNFELTNTSNIFCSFLILIFFLKGGISLLSIYSSDIDTKTRLGQWGEYLIYSMIAYTISIFTNFYYIHKEKLWLKNLSLLFVVNSVVLISMLALSGYRSNLLQICIPFIFIYDKYYKRIPKWTVCLIICLGLIIMTYSGLTRQGGNVNLGSIDFFTLLQDFYTANAANIFFVDYADNNGFTYGTNWFPHLLCIIPFFQGLFFTIFDNSFIAPTSSSFFTNIMDSVNTGLGTGIIGDIYYSFGFIGVCISMFFLGYFCTRLSNYRNGIMLVMYLVFLGNSIFSCRVEFFYIVRMMAFSAILMWIEMKISGTNKTDFQ